MPSRYLASAGTPAFIVIKMDLISDCNKFEQSGLVSGLSLY